MPNYKIVHRGPAANQQREVRISATATATPSGFDVLVASIAMDQTDKKALFHLVQDELYKIGVQNTQDLIIRYEGPSSIPAPDFHIWETEVHLAPLAAYAVQVYDLPTALADPEITIDNTVNAAVATVAVVGKVITITAVAAGQTSVGINILGEKHHITVYVEIPISNPPVEEEEEG